MKLDTRFVDTMKLLIVLVVCLATTEATTIRLQIGNLGSVFMDSSSTILQLKVEIQNNEGTPPELQLLTFGGEELTDHERTIESYNMQDGSEIGWRMQGWGRWLDWSACSKECGAGIQTRIKRCFQANAGDTNCEGVCYELQTCDNGPCTAPTPTDEEIADRKAQMICDFFHGGPVYGYGKGIRVGNCHEICAAEGRLCGGTFKIYPNPERRLSKGLTQVFEYPNCATRHSNACCCVDPAPPVPEGTFPPGITRPPGRC